jgi:hypothetical protein
MVKLEGNFVDLAFWLGEIDGVKPKEIRAYVSYVADWRLTSSDFRRGSGTLKLFNGTTARHGVFESCEPRQLGRDGGVGLEFDHRQRVSIARVK